MYAVFISRDLIQPIKTSCLTSRSIFILFWFYVQTLITMSLPPEQISIKRRREEEPVETLCRQPYSPMQRQTGVHHSPP